MAGKRKVKPLVKLVEKHWSHWLDEHACSSLWIPTYVRDAATPDIAWKNAAAENLIWVLEEFGVVTNTNPFYDNETGDYDEDKIRAKYPNPPRKVLASLNKWLKQKETYED